MSWKDLYSEVKKRKMEALNKKDVVKAVEQHGKILAIEGRFEKPEDIIKNMYVSEYKIIKYGKKAKSRERMINEILNTDFSKYDILLIGCPGEEIPFSAHHKILNYVNNQGGWLITTDWAIKFIVEAIFPGYIRWNRKRTDDAVVACQILEPNHPFLDGVLGEIQQSKWSNKATKDTKTKEFRWWLEYRSFPIDIINPNEVNLLIASQEIEQKWGSNPVLLYFNYGKTGGRVIHMISHTHLQKGGLKGKYASALILSNILDEKISQKLNLSKGSTPQYVDYSELQSHSQNTPIPSSDPWLAPPQENNYLTPSTSQSGIGLTGTSQIVEADDTNFSFSSICTYCTYDFTDFKGKIYICKECGAPYHDNCLNIQINEGICKNCGRILLW
ncbi:MAG: hypothetical protein ACFFAO_01900 [Candidatus Hermodarchaeota archaeon]